LIITTKSETKTAKGKKDKTSPLRQCALTRQQRPVDELIRFVLSPEQIVTPDLRCKLPGRGLWLGADKSIIAEAIKKKVFARGFRQKALVTDDLADMVEKLTRIEALHTLSLANKAGLVITGYEKIKRALAKGEVKWLLHAFEASRNGSDKLDRYFTPPPTEPAQTDDQKQVSGVLTALFASNELNLALGRANVIHVGLKQGEMARRFTFALQKAVAFKTPEPVEISLTTSRAERKDDLNVKN
jgi:predicted RNA-binding protein YlxR (DUF448 family)